MTNADYHTPASCGETIKSVYCFEIAPGYRGKGIAHLLLTRIIDDARKEGCSCVEGYPFSDRTLEYQFHGPIRLYEAHGFRMIAEKADISSPGIPKGKASDFPHFRLIFPFCLKN